LAKDNKAAEIRQLVDKFGVSACYGNQIGQTGLHIAAIWGCIDAGAALIELGADVNAQNDLSGSSPLHMGATRGRLEMCRMLLQHGADHLMRDDSGRVAAEMAEQPELKVRPHVESRTKKEQTVACIARSARALTLLTICAVVRRHYYSIRPHCHQKLHQPQTNHSRRMEWRYHCHQCLAYI
jgi:ankyrin repeat protein